MKRRTAELIVHEGDDWSIGNPETYIFSIYWDEESEEFFIRGDIENLSRQTAYKVGYALMRYSITGPNVINPKSQETQQHSEGSHGVRNDYRSGFVYIVHSNGAYKIGHAKIVDKRIEQISPVLPFPVELVIAIAADDRYALERELHERFADKRLNGEWFVLTEEDLFDLGVRK